METDRIRNYIESLKKFIEQNERQMYRSPSGLLKHPYIVPCSPESPYYSDTLWDWDSWLTTISMGQLAEDSGNQESLPYEKGSVLDFLELCTEDGVMPICVTPEKTLDRMQDHGSPFLTNMHKPVLAQQIAALVLRDGKTDWIAPWMGRLEAFLDCYRKHHCNEETGLFFWQDDFAVGVDNDPSVFYRPARSCGSIYLNSLMYREFLAFGYLLELSGDVVRANLWRGRASSLADAVNRYCFDERDGTYYSVDFGLLPVNPADWLHSGAPRDYPCVLMRIDNWSSFLPLWAGIADAGQAERMLLRLKDERTFACRAGVRSLSRLEKMYSLRASNNPSNWRGPVWGISSYMIFSGLVRYGFYEEAQKLAYKTIYLFGRDLETSGTLHEYYHPDTLMPIMTHNFQNWNFLVLNMIAWLEGRKFVDTF